MGLIAGEYRVFGVPGRLRPLARPWGAPGTGRAWRWGVRSAEPRLAGWLIGNGGVAPDANGCVFRGAWRPMRWAKKLAGQHHRFGLTHRYCSRLDQSPLLWIRVVTARTCRCGHIRLPASFLELLAPFFRLPACSAPTLRPRTATAALTVTGRSPRARCRLG